MLRLLAVLAGGSMGALLRYLISGIASKGIPGTFPFGTLMINLAGSLMIGFLWGGFKWVQIPDAYRLFIFVGFLGSFTTFSTFSLETFQLLKTEQYAYAVWYVLGSNLGGIALAATGYFGGKLLLSS